MRQASATSVAAQADVVLCDVVVVGGGIAGVACAERLSREARRQNIRLRVLLVEQEEQIGWHTSGGLEGWYHAGALYSNREDTRHMAHCVNSMEDLYNWYRRDPALFVSILPYACNLKPITEQNPRPQFEIPDMPTAEWFVGEINYILPLYSAESNQPGHRGSEAKWGRAASQMATAQAKALVAQVYFDCDWRNKYVSGWCEAPQLGLDAHRSPLWGPVDGRRGSIIDKPFRDILGLCLATDTATKREALAEYDRRQKRMADILITMDENEQTSSDLMISRDAVMNTVRVLSDLLSASKRNGVKVLTGYELMRGSVEVSRITGRISGIRIRGGDSGKMIDVIAEQYVFALGAGFDEGDFLRKRLNVPLRVEKHLSVMVAESPASCRESFVRMGYPDKDEFNHIHHPGPSTSIQDGYTIVADSNALPEDADGDTCAEKALALIEKRRRICPSIEDGVRIGWYSCGKTEFVSIEEGDRDYSWRIYPRVDRYLVDSDWQKARSNRKGASLRIQKLVLDLAGSPEVSSLDDYLQIAENPDDSDRSSAFDETVINALRGVRALACDGWALNRALHYALQLVASEHNAFPGATRCFDVVRHVAMSAFDQQYLNRNSPLPNYLCVVPGKFSLFPSLAHNVYIEMEGRRLYKTQGNYSDYHGVPWLRDTRAKATRRR